MSNKSEVPGAASVAAVSGEMHAQVSELSGSRATASTCNNPEPTSVAIPTSQSIPTVHHDTALASHDHDSTGRVHVASPAVSDRQVPPEPDPIIRVPGTEFENGHEALQDARPFVLRPRAFFVSWSGFMEGLLDSKV